MPERVAILVIHGIGQQKPYETLDQFTRNLTLNLGADWTVEPQLDRAVDPTKANKSWVRTSYKVSRPAGPVPFDSDPNAQIQDITLFEYYWAPITQGKITYRGSLLFLIRAGLMPFLYLVSNINVIRLATNGSFFKVLWHELWRQFCFFLPLLALLLALLIELSSGAYMSLFKQPHLKAATVVTLGILAIRYLYLFATVRALDQSRNVSSGSHPSGWKLLLAVTIAIHIFAWPMLLAPVVCSIACLGTVVAHCYPYLRALGHWSTHLRHFAQPLTFPFRGHVRDWLRSLVFIDPSFAKYKWDVLIVVLMLWLRNILTNLVGDLAVYLNSDTFASSFAARTQILIECSAALTAILKEEAAPGIPKYDRVLIAAHSLGSVIAYDTMNQLLNEARTTSVVAAPPTQIVANDLRRLRGLVTFGCPLNKTFYFFRPFDAPQLTLRAQTLNLLYGFRLNRALMSNVGVVPTLYPFPPFPASPPPQLPGGEPGWQPAEIALEADFTWINAYSPMDPISGDLIFYIVNQQISINHLPPLVAHVRYWEDKSFYDFVRKYLL